MPTNFEKYEEIEQEINELRTTLPKTADAMSDEQLAKLWELIDRQHGYIELLKDAPRN